MELHEWYLLCKSLHIIFVVTWFAGLFYIVRLFVNHTEASEKPEPEKSILTAQYKKMERPLWIGITWPSMILASTFGTILFFLNPALIYMPHMHIKLTLVFLLMAYHFYIQVLYKKYSNNIIAMSSFALRVYNEIASIFLVAIIFTIEFERFLNWKYLVGGLLIFCALLFYVIVRFNRRRKNQ
ncbi:MAG: CopD family protein [Flavobacteriales bacterium]